MAKKPTYDGSEEPTCDDVAQDAKRLARRKTTKALARALVSSMSGAKLARNQYGAPAKTVTMEALMIQSQEAHIETLKAEATLIAKRLEQAETYLAALKLQGQQPRADGIVNVVVPDLE